MVGTYAETVDGVVEAVALRKRVLVCTVTARHVVITSAADQKICQLPANQDVIALITVKLAAGKT
ncbi:hypothetical protein D3C87_1224370 [compost metagenome]